MIPFMITHSLSAKIYNVLVNSNATFRITVAVRLLFGKYPLLTVTRLLAEIYCGFPQSLQGNTAIVPLKRT
jgi:hypothetical protein